MKCNSGFREVIFLVVKVLFEHLLRINFIPKDGSHLLQGFTFYQRSKRHVTKKALEGLAFCFGEEKCDGNKVHCVQTNEQQVKFPTNVGHPNRRRFGNQYVEQPVRARSDARPNGPRPGRKHLIDVGQYICSASLEISSTDF